MSRWILLPTKFTGIWYSPSYGGFHIYLRDRFKPVLAPDRLKEALRKYHPDLVKDRKDHESAKPIWMSKEEFEKQFGKIEAIVVNGKVWKSDNYDGYYDSLFFFTEKYVVVLQEYDGHEYFLEVPRDWRMLVK